MRRQRADSASGKVRHKPGSDLRQQQKYEERLYEAVSIAAGEALAGAEWWRSVRSTLEQLGHAGQLSRACLYKVSTDGDEILSRRRQVWPDSDPATGERRQLARIRLRKHGLERWIDTLGNGDVIHGPLAELPESERSILQDQGIRSLAVAPVFAGSRWWGYLTLEDHDSDRAWCDAEIKVLHAAAGIIGAAIYRQEMEEHLRDSEERLRRLSDAAEEGIVIHDGVTIVDLNDAAARIGGYQREELIGFDARRLTTPESWQIMERHIATGYERPYEIIGVRKDGSTILCQVVGKPCQYHGRSLRVVAIRDITRQKRTERELVMQRIRFEQLFENTPLAILMGDAEDRIVSINPAFEQLFGFSRKDVIGRYVNDLITPDGLEEEASSISHDVCTGSSVHKETVRRRKDGSLVNVAVYGVPVVLDTQAVGVYGIYVDQTERIQAEQALRESEERFRSLAEQSLQGIFVLAGGRLVYANRMMAEISGYSREDLISWGPRGLEKIIHPSDRNVVMQVLRALDNGSSRTTPQIEYRINTGEGRLKWVLQQARVICYDGEPAVQGLVVDITKRKLAEEQLLTATLYDALTGLPNRALFYDRVEMAIERVRVDSSTAAFAVVILDLDRFKVINDSLGHMFGDQLLMEIARRLEQVVRPGDTVARLGGDEFAILLNSIRDAAETAVVAERIQATVSIPYQIGQHEVFSTASIGISLSTSGYRSPDEIMRDADIATNQAKERGRARHEIFEPVMRSTAVSLQRLETELRRAVDRGEFTLFYQPIVSLESQRVVAFEALLRWLHPERGLILPSEFLPLTEETGLIIPIGEWVLDQACRQIRGWDRFCNGHPAPAISVNLFSRQFTQPELVGLIKKVLHETGANARNLHLEITESAVIDDPERAIHVLRKLKDLDLTINLDDFGTGYSSLSYLQRFAVDVLKIDQSFIAKIGGNDKGTEIVEAIVTLAHKLGMKALGEGIETAEQLAQLTALGCEYGQGFYFSSAVAAADATRLLETQESKYLSELCTR
jgi:diguanylate cyclase (GGDEF)-like protein/PAS domain S-box-containing protein